MIQKHHRKQPFTLIEICVCLALLLALTSVFSYLGYDAVKEFRKRNGRAAFKDTLLYLQHENSIKENNLMLLINQKGEFLETTLGGNTTGLNIKKKQNRYYVGKLFPDDTMYAIKITPRIIPTDKSLISWIETNNCIYQFYTD